MQTYFECIPCFVRQALDVARFVTDDETIHELVMREVLRRASEIDLRQTPPMMGQYIHRLVREVTGSEDPYRKVKEYYNNYALKLYPELKEKIARSLNPLETAMRLAIAGNIIDFGPNSHLEDRHVRDAISHCFRAELFGSNEKDFHAAVTQADKILYLADNAGEIVFDRLLIEQLPYEKITLVVKAGPIINDATMNDARVAGLTDLVEVIDNGSDAPGTILEICPEEFRRRFDEADLIVAKGQGNYETLSDENKDIFFLFKVKCPVIAKDSGLQVGSLALQRKDVA